MKLKINRDEKMSILWRKDSNKSGNRDSSSLEHTRTKNGNRSADEHDNDSSNSDDDNSSTSSSSHYSTTSSSSLQLRTHTRKRTHKNRTPQDAEPHRSSRTSRSSSNTSTNPHGRKQLGLPRFQMRNRKQSLLTKPVSTAPYSSLSLSNSHEYDSSQNQQTSTRTSSRKTNRNHSRGRNHSRNRNKRQNRRDGNAKTHSIVHLYKESFKILLSKKSSIILLFSALIWLYVQYHVSNENTKPNRRPRPMFSKSHHDLENMKRIHQKLKSQRKDRENSAFEALGSAAGNFFKRKKKPHVETIDIAPKRDRLPKGCVYQEWQELTPLNCNDIHDLDLRGVVRSQRQKKQKNIPRQQPKQPKVKRNGNRTSNNSYFRNRTHTLWIRNSNFTSTDSETIGGTFLGSGLWRQVWKLQPKIGGEDAVLKIMKMEHDANIRNFDRHRRDALVMERLTKSKHIVSGYGFCGNTVLTEFAGITLDDFLRQKKKRAPKYVDTKSGNATSTFSNITTTVGPPSLDTMTSENIIVPERYKKTNPLHKIELSLDIMKGLEAMHNTDIVHADIQAKQFLMDAVDGVKLNDFNRCRLLPVNNKTGNLCPVKIPSSPGGSRSPEEYEMQTIDSKIDIFSTGNILFYILTGELPWGREVMRLEIQKNVKKGILPEIKEHFRTPGTIDAGLANIVLNAFSFKPQDRWNATQIIDELERIRNENSTE